MHVKRSYSICLYAITLNKGSLEKNLLYDMEYDSREWEIQDG
jgi:hypothetical protein